MNGKDSKKYVIWDDNNEVPFIIIMNKSKRTSYGLFLHTSDPAEIQTIPS